MSRSGPDAITVAKPAEAGLHDWRVERLVALMGEGWLAGQWDAERRLVLPRPGGRLTRVVRCAVSDCPSDCYGPSRLCLRHRRQFESSELGDLGDWLRSGAPASSSAATASTGPAG